MFTIINLLHLPYLVGKLEVTLLLQILGMCSLIVVVEMCVMILWVIRNILSPCLGVCIYRDIHVYIVRHVCLCELKVIVVSFLGRSKLRSNHTYALFEV